MALDQQHQWIRDLFADREPRWEGGREFLLVLLDYSKRHRFRVLLIDELMRRQEKMKLPLPVRDELVAHMRQEVALEILRCEEVCRVVAALNEAGLSYMLFKGTPLAYTLYPEACLRDRGDTDLLFASRGDAEQAWRVVREMGYKRMNSAGGELTSYQFPCSLNGGRVAEVLDLHWATSNDAALRVFSFEELRAGSVNVLSLCEGARSPCPAHTLVLACLHRLGHVKDGEENKLIWLYDIYLLVASLDDVQWQRFLSCARDKGVAGACYDGAEHAVACFGTAECGAYRLEELRQLAALPGQHVSAHATVLARDIAQLRSARGMRRLQLLAEYLFPPVTYMQTKYQPRWRWLLPWYYAQRIVQGTGQRLRGHWAGSR